MSARFIPATVHGVLDHLVSGVDLAAPALLCLEGAAAFAPRVAGDLGAGHSLLVTGYELGLARVVPMPARLALGTAKGVLGGVAVALRFRRERPALLAAARDPGRLDAPVAETSEKG